MDFEGLHQIAGALGDDTQAVRRHYATIGLPLLAAFDPPGLLFFALTPGSAAAGKGAAGEGAAGEGAAGEAAAVEEGAVRLMLDRNAAPVTFYLRVADLDATYTTLREAGVEFLDAPHLVYRDDDGRFGPPGSAEWMTFVRDPAGNLLGLVERRQV